MLAEEPYGPKVDIFALGCFLILALVPRPALNSVG
jgi:hypothetical protein